MKNLLIALILFTFNQLFSQELVSMKDVYIDNSLVYRSSNDKLLTGTAQKIRKNGHLVYEEKYEDGIILYRNLYYNGEEVRVSNKIFYNPNKPFIIAKENKYNLDGNIFETVTYNQDGVKILVEQFNNGNLTYSCQYLGKKKHGLNIGYDENGEKITYRCEYINGKKNGKEYCLNKNGTETIKEYQNGKMPPN